LATVRTISARLEKTGGAENGKCLRACLRYAAFFGVLATLLLFAFARPLSVFALKDVRTERALYLLSFTLLPIALTSVLNGYFVAVRRAWKNAVSQISEQSIKILLTGYLLVFLAPKSVEGCVLAILCGGAVAETFSLVFNLILFALDKRRFRDVPPVKSGFTPRVADIALPVAISAYARSGLLAIEHILIPRGLLSYGAGGAEALYAYGALQSMALPVVLYPAAIMTAFAGLLIPEVTEQQSANNRVEIRYIARRVYQLTLLFSLGTAAVMLSFSAALGEALYHSSEVGKYIRLLAPLIPIMYLDTATDALLKGLGEQVYSMRVNILDALVSVLCVAILVPQTGIMGYLLTIYITEILNAALSVTRLLRVSGFSPRFGELLLRPLLCAVGGVCALRLLLNVLPFTAPLPILMLLAVLIYVLFLTVTGSFGKNERKWLRNFIWHKEKRAEK
ncbi:MAG: polysaccharide biosynthesis C-terminal domain-containing protein, partial [Clostridia bacterium]|nr:polysaccharide biosynthesis C-terminal domain-containing protein [Clostridia bacterium]